MPIWISYAGLTDLFVHHVIPFQNRGIKPVRGWFVLDAVTKHPLPEVQFFNKTRTPLTTWFEAAWHLTMAKNGLSAKTLQRTLGTSYRTVWKMLHRYRIAMVRSEREQLLELLK